MHYTSTDIVAQAEPAGNGWSKAVLKLAEGDTAYSGVSAKYDWRGPGTVTYMIHGSGWTITPEGVTRRHR